VLGSAPRDVVVAFDVPVAVPDPNLIAQHAGLLIPHPAEPLQSVSSFGREFGLGCSQCARIFAQGVQEHVLYEAGGLDQLQVVARIGPPTLDVYRRDAQRGEVVDESVVAVCRRPVDRRARVGQVRGLAIEQRGVHFGAVALLAQETQLVRCQHGVARVADHEGGGADRGLLLELDPVRAGRAQRAEFQRVRVAPAAVPGAPVSTRPYAEGRPACGVDDLEYARTQWLAAQNGRRLGCLEGKSDLVDTHQDPALVPPGAPRCRRTSDQQYQRQRDHDQQAGQQPTT